MSVGEYERRGPEQHITHVGGVEAEGEAAGGVPPGAEYVYMAGAKRMERSGKEEKGA